MDIPWPIVSKNKQVIVDSYTTCLEWHRGSHQWSSTKSCMVILFLIVNLYMNTWKTSSCRTDHNAEYVNNSSSGCSSSSMYFTYYILKCCLCLSESPRLLIFMQWIDL
ncbi:hypothetical protein J132_03069 [Termitomyces sp. J132]|nr:hypothetical protein J132_03069 [Termitomyces sp. J132]